MVNSSKKGRTKVCLFICIFFIFLSLACTLREMAKPVVEEVYLKGTLTEQAYRDTQDALWETALSEAYTQDARTRESANMTASPTPAPPRIVQIYFPSSIQGDGETNYGELTFSDLDGDVNRITIDVVQADNFDNSDYDPSPYLIYGSNYSGTYQLYIWCQGQQSVTLRTTLYDLKGNRSNSVDFSFVCE